MRTSSSLVAAFLLAAATAASAATVTLFHESFDGNNQNWSYSNTGSASYDHLWTETNTVKPGYKGVKLGSTSATGGITSEAFSISNTAADVSIVIVAAAYQNNGGGKEGIAVTVYDASDSLIFSDGVSELTQHSSTAKDEIPTTAAFTKTFTVPAASLPSSGGIHLKIESTYTKTGQRRALLGDVLVTQTYSSGDNTPPAATQASVGVNATVGTAVSLDLADYFSDADGDTLAYAVDSGIGTVSGSTWTFTPDAAGSFSAVVSATDPSGVSATMTIAVTAVSAGPAPLDAPANLAASSIAENGFSLVWDAVEHAAGYAVEILDGSSVAAGSATVSGTGATVTGLSADTEYTAKVKATAAANSTDYEDSAWSDAIVVKTTLAGGLLRATLFDETFDSVGGTGWGNSGALQNTDESGWTTAGNVYRAPEGLRLGTGSNPGAATTREIAVSNAIENAEVVISFLAASYSGKKTAGTLTLSNTVTGVSTVLTNLNPAAMSNDASEPLAGGTPYEFEATVPARFTLRFESLSTASDKRLLLDSIKVTQVYDPNYAVLAAPTGVTSNNIEKFSVTVAWGTVANASGYEVWLDDAPIGLCDTTSTNLTGLTAGTTYKVQVRAKGDNLHYGDSPLSTAISVTTLADAQKIDFTVTGAPSAPVYAGDPVSFTVTAEVEATGAAAEVSFSGIAGATFTAATGAFAWTPTESDVGDNVAKFTSGAYSTNVTITVLSTSVTTNLFHETFAGCVTGWRNTAAMPANGTTNSTTYVVENGWTFSHCYRGNSGLKMGTTSVFGTATTRAIDPTTPGTVSLSFRAAAFLGETGELTVTAAGGASWSQTVSLTAMTDTNALPAGANYDFGPYVIPVTDDFTLTFAPASGDGRMGVDEILVVQTTPARIVTLTAPVPTLGGATISSLVAAWTTVADAEGYGVQLLDAATGGIVQSIASQAATNATFTGLAANHEYAVRVRALGDGTATASSPWAQSAAERTLVDVAAPTFTASEGASDAVEARKTKTFAVTAERNDDTVPVELGAFVPAAAGTAPSFSFNQGTGVFSWTPTDADAGQTFTATFTTDYGAYSTNIAFAVTARPALAPPTVSTNGPLGVKTASFVWNEQSRATGYAIRLWRGTADYNKPVCFEDFGDGGTMPDGWTGIGTEWYDKSGYESSRVKFATDGATLISKLHSAPVTNLSFHTRSSSTSATSQWTLYASHGGTGDADWILISSSTIATSKTSPITRSFDASSDYRRFKWVFTKGTGTLGLGDIAAAHEGATAQFVVGSAAAPVEIGNVQTYVASDLRAGREYFLEVTARDAEAGDSKSTVYRFSTRPANPATMLVFK